MIPASDFWPNFMRNEAGNALCRYYAARGGAALGSLAGGGLGGWFGGQPGSLGGRRVGSWIGGGAGAAIGAAICPDTPPNTGDYPISPDPGFQGGCTDGVLYSGLFDYTRDDGLVQVSGLGLCWGAVTGLSVQRDGNGSRIFVVCRGDGNLPIQAPGTLVTRVDAPSEIYVSAEITSLFRIDGVPDICPPGSRTPVFPEPGDIPDLRDDPAANTEINIDVDFGGTTINIGGNLRIVAPVFAPRFGVDFNFDGLDFRWYPDAPIDIGGGEPQPEPGTPPNEDEPPTGQLFKGVFYNVTNVGEGTRSEFITAGEFFYPRFGSVRFTGKGRFSESIPMAVTSGFLVNPAPDWFDNFIYTPYRTGSTAQFFKWFKGCECDSADKIQPV